MDLFLECIFVVITFDGDGLIRRRIWDFEGSMNRLFIVVFLCFGSAYCQQVCVPVAQNPRTYLDPQVIRNIRYLESRHQRSIGTDS